MERKFLRIWSCGAIFCEVKDGRPLWHPAPHHEFLTGDYNTRFSSTRIDRRKNAGLGAAAQSPTHSESVPGESGISPPPSPRLWALAPTPLAVRSDTRLLALPSGPGSRMDVKMTQLTADLLRQLPSHLPSNLQSQQDLAQQAAFWVGPPGLSKSNSHRGV